MKPTKPLRERKKPGELSQTELYAQVKDSTERNRQFFFIWIAFALYVIVTTVATTDLQLLLPNSTVTLPALGIQLPLIGFFLVTPWLVLILHFNLLQNLDSHANKLKQWADTYPNQMPSRAALPAFLFDFALLEQGGAFPRLTQIASQIAFYAVGPITIGILFWRFSDYQDLFYTGLQLLALLLSLSLVFKSRSALNETHRDKVSISVFSYFVVYTPIVAIIVLQTFWAICLAFSKDSLPLSNWLDYEILLPRINIPQSTSLVTLPVDLPARMALDGEKDVHEWWTKYGVGADLEARSLKDAVLSNVDLRRANLRDANLQRAYLTGAKLQGGNLLFTHLQGAVLIFTQLQGATLLDTQLQGALIQEAQLNDATLENIGVDKKTNFSRSFTNEKTTIYVNSDQNFGIDLVKTLTLRERLRDENNLRLPSILYKQLSVPSVVMSNDVTTNNINPQAILFPVKVK